MITLAEHADRSRQAGTVSGEIRGEIRGALRGLADLLLPVSCVCCGAEQTDMCSECVDDLRLRVSRPFRAEVSAESLPLVPPESLILSAPQECLDALVPLPVYSAGVYDDVLSRTLLAFKEQEYIRLRRVLGPALAGSIRAALRDLLPPPGQRRPRLLLVSPPPSLRARLRRSYQPVPALMAAEPWLRGSFPSGVLRHRISGRWSTAVLGPVQQKSRSAMQRRMGEQILAPTRHGRRLLENADVMIVDDVLTTGATIHHLYRVLTEAGARVYGAAVLAAVYRGDSVTDSA